MSFRCLFAVLAASLATLTITASAQESAEATTDYGSAFETFHKLGLPRVPADATFVVLHVNRPYRTHRYNPIMQGQLRNGAWMLPGEASPRSFITVSGRQLDVYDREAYMQKMQAEAGDEDDRRMHVFMGTGMVTDDGAVVGSWQEADAAEQLKTLMSALSPDADTEEGRGKMRQIDRYLSGGHASAGPVMLAAIGFYNKGFKEEANTIVGRLFELGKDKRKVIMQTISAIADNRLEAATESFARNRDWQAYRDAVAKIHKQTAPGWEKAGGAELLIEKLDARIGGNAPLLEGEHVTDLDREYVAELAEASIDQAGMQQAMRRRMGGGFLNPAFCRDVFASTNATVLSKLTARGPEGIPLLAALLEDAYLTPIMSSEAGQLGMHHFGMQGGTSFHGRGSAMADAEKIYASLPHPLARGDLAKSVLIQLVPVDDRRRGRLMQMTASELRRSALDFYEESRGKSPFELAEIYLKEGNSTQRNLALQALQAADMPEVREMLKDYILNEGEPMQMMHIVMQYAQRGGPDAAPVVEAFIAKYKEAVEEQMAQHAGMRGAMRSYEQQMENLKALVAGADLGDLLAELDAETYMHKASAIQQQLSQMPAQKAMGQLLAAAVEAEVPFRRTMIVGMTQMLAMPGYAQAARMAAGAAGEFDAEAFKDGDFYKTVVNTPGKTAPSAGGGATAESGGADEETLDLQAFRDQWETLLADKREFDNPMMRMYQPGMQGPRRVCDSVAWSLAALALRDDMTHGGMSVYHLYTLGDRVNTLLHEVARAALAGRTGDDLPSLPAAKDVEKKTVDKLVARMETMPAAKVKAFLDQRSLSELLALQQRLGAESELNSKLAEYANRITDVAIDGEFAEAAARLSDFNGGTVSSNLLTNAIAVCRALVADGTEATVTVVRNPWLAGTVLRCSEPGDGQSAQQMAYRQAMMMGGGMWGESQNEEQRFVTATISGGGAHGNARWKVDVPGADTSTDDRAENNAKLKFLEEMGVEMKGKISAAQMSEMMDAMGQMSRQMDQQMEREQKRFWEGLERFKEGKRAALQGASITVTGMIVKPEDDGDETGKRGTR